MRLDDHPTRSSDAAPTDRSHYTIDCASGNRYVIYRPEALGNPTDHREDRWYFRPFPVPPGIVPGDSFASPMEAEDAARRHDAGH